MGYFDVIKSPTKHFETENLKRTEEEEGRRMLEEKEDREFDSSGSPRTTT